MPAERLGLYNLLAPAFLAGFNFPDHIHRYLSVLGVDELRTALDERAVVFSGRASFTGEAGALPVREHRDPSGAVFQWEDVTLDFRLTFPRDGTAYLATAVGAVAAVRPQLDNLFQRFGPTEQTALVPTEYPGVRFRLELLLSALTFHLGDTWLPGRLDSSHRVVHDTSRDSNDVRIVLPKVVFVIEQGEDLEQPPSFQVRSWGSSGFEAPADLAAGELVRMEPPLAVHRSGRIAFAIDRILLDLSQDHTPPEILAFFGTDESFEGLFIKHLRIFYGDASKDFAFNLGVRDALISFKGEVSLEADAHLIGPESDLEVEVKFFQGAEEVEYTRGRPRPEGSPDHLVGGEASVINTAVVQVHVTGGVPPLSISVRLDGEELWDPSTRTAPLSPDAPSTLRPAGTYALVVEVRDSGPEGRRQVFTEEISLTVREQAAPSAEPDGAPADRPPRQGERPAASFSITSTTPSPLPEGFGITHSPSASGIAETLYIAGGDPAQLQVTVNGTPRTLEGRRLTLDVPEGSEASPIQIVVEHPATGGTREETFHLRFEIDRPDPEPPVWDAIRQAYVEDREQPPDAPFSSSTAPSTTTTPRPTGVAALTDWVQTQVRPGAEGQLELEAHASFERAANEARDQVISERRLAIARAIIERARPGVSFVRAEALGHQRARAAGRRDDPDDRVVEITGRVGPPATPAVRIEATLSRAERPPAEPPPERPEVEHPPEAPPPPANEAPSVFRRIGLRLRLERNVPVLAEVSGTLDFETAFEERLRDASDNDSGDLQLEQQPAASANPNPEDGVVDFTLTVTYDTATRALTETLKLGASPDDVNGLLRMSNPRGEGAQTTFKDIFGALLIFAPIINEAASGFDAESAGDWVALTVSLGVPVTLGGLGVFQTRHATLYGGELRLRQHVPSGEDVTFSEAGVVFDYGVEFGIEISQLGIRTTRPLKVRYKAVGFNLHFAADGALYQPIFDTRQGYELDLSDPGLFELPGGLGNILKVLGARLARFNPLTLELDLGTKVDLGVVTVDRFKVKWPLQPLEAPTILPSGVKVDIPGALAGSGYVNILEGGGIEGSLDVSLVPVKLRLAASLGLRSVSDPATSRSATAVFAGLEVEFPSPLVLGSSGLGLFGINGLFAMHYKRLEEPRAPGDSVSPALKWLEKAKGQPSQLVVEGVRLWGPEFDRWSFGVGVILGSLDGGFLVNLRGTLVLELPGPRLLVFVKALFAQQRPQPGESGLTTGMLGVLDIDFGLKQITLGLLVDLSIEKLLELKLPVELFFDWRDPKDWHLHIGTFRQPVSARVLNLVRASGYFMIDGGGIEDFPLGDGTRDLPGIAVATGIEASILLGSESAGLYLKVAAGAHLGVSFSPRLFMVGRIFLEGELHLFIVTIGAHGKLDIEAPNPTLIHGEICGKVSFFFFSVQGCVGLSIGEGEHELPAPPLVRNVYLQSHAPVLMEGQGGDRPIDASLGDAVSTDEEGELPVVPVDSVPVVQLHASPLVDGATTFSEPLEVSPALRPGGWIEVGGGRQVRYVLKEVHLEPPLPAGTERPPATWRPEVDPKLEGAKTNIDLALFSREPVTGARAFERSTELDEKVRVRWEGLCDPVAPPACVLWTFCDQPLGPSGSGWELDGIPAEDPPGTTRRTPPPTRLVVEEPKPAAGEALLSLALRDAGLPFLAPARVIGPGARPPPPEEEVPEANLCVDFDRPEPGGAPNPLTVEGVRFTVFDSRGRPLSRLRLVGTSGSTFSLDCGFRTEIQLPRATPRVDLALRSQARPAQATALDERGQVVARARTGEARGQPSALSLRGTGITRVVIEAPQDETLLLRLCYAGRRRPPVLDRLPELGPHLPRERPPTGSSRRARLVEGLMSRRTERAHRLAEATRLRPSGAARALPSPARRLGERFRLARRSTRCLRALQLPQHWRRRLRDPLKVPEEARAFFEEQAENRWILLHTGPAQRVILFLAVDKRLLGGRALRLRQLDAEGHVLVDDALSELAPQPVTGTTDGMPSAWLDPDGPWRDDLQQVAGFLASPEFSSLQRLVVKLEPREACERLQLQISSTQAPQAPHDRVLLGAIEVCSAAERLRAETEERIKQGELRTLLGYLNEGDPIPLLAPDTAYTLRLTYDAITKAADGSESTEEDRTQSFRFRTDSRPPARLDPYVLATLPGRESPPHFYQDAVKLVFNDLAVLQLFGAYGRKLRVALHTADGVPVPTEEVTTLEPVSAELGTPYRDFLEALVAAGLLPCAGTIEEPRHGSWTVPVPLRPAMDYTLDVELEPPYPAPPEDTPRVPLFRRTFTTSRYASVAELIQATRGRRIRQRALASPLSGLGGGTGVVVASDEALQEAFLDAGEQALPAPEETGITLYWARPSGEPYYVPHALLIDAAEPLWREREAPKLETVPGQSDPAYQRVVPGTETALEILETGGGHVQRFVHSPGGTRTLALLAELPSPLSGALTLRLAVHQPASTLYALSDESWPLVELTVGPRAPWEEEP